MDKSKNYYAILGANIDDDKKEIKKKYYKLSNIHHPDKTGLEESDIFNNIKEAYSVLYNEDTRKDYDNKSKWGKNYNEYYEFFDMDFQYDSKDTKDKLENFKKYEVNNIEIEVEDRIIHNFEYNRFVRCKSCDGSGKDFKNKIPIKDKQGNILKYVDPYDGCDFCEGSGKDYNGNECGFCNGHGKIGLINCKSCEGEKRIFGKQKIKRIEIPATENSIKLYSMGNYSKTGQVGTLIIKLK